MFWSKALCPQWDTCISCFSLLSGCGPDPTSLFSLATRLLLSSTNKDWELRFKSDPFLLPTTYYTSFDQPTLVAHFFFFFYIRWGKNNEGANWTSLWKKALIIPRLALEHTHQRAQQPQIKVWSLEPRPTPCLFPKQLCSKEQRHWVHNLKKLWNPPVWFPRAPQSPLRKQKVNFSRKEPPGNWVFSSPAKRFGLRGFEIGNGNSNRGLPWGFWNQGSKPQVFRGKQKPSTEMQILHSDKWCDRLWNEELQLFMTIVLCVIMAATSCPQTLNESVAYRRKYRPFILALEGSLQFAQCRSFRRYFPQPCIPDKSFPSHSFCIYCPCFQKSLYYLLLLFWETTSFYLPLFHQSKSSLFTINSVCVSLMELIHYFSTLWERGILLWVRLLWRVFEHKDEWEFSLDSSAEDRHAFK